MFSFELYETLRTGRTEHLWMAAYALIHLTNKIKNEIEMGNYACGIFKDFQKAFEL